MEDEYVSTHIAAKVPDAAVRLVMDAIPPSRLRKPRPLKREIKNVLAMMCDGANVESLTGRLLAHKFERYYRSHEGRSDKHREPLTLLDDGFWMEDESVWSSRGPSLYGGPSTPGDPPAPSWTQEQWDQMKREEADELHTLYRLIREDQEGIDDLRDAWVDNQGRWLPSSDSDDPRDWPRCQRIGVIEQAQPH